MPPIRKIKREDIINISLKILKTEDIESINARRIAEELHSSVQPIFYNFKSMKELKEEIKKKIYELYKSYMIKGSKEVNPYKGMGIAYINFARENPNYFKLIFMNETKLSAIDFILNDDIGNNVIEYGIKYSHLTREEQKRFHTKVWIFTHGLATLVSGKTIDISKIEIEKLLTEAVEEMLMGIKEKKNEKCNRG